MNYTYSMYIHTYMYVLVALYVFYVARPPPCHSGPCVLLGPATLPLLPFCHRLSSCVPWSVPKESGFYGRAIHTQPDSMRSITDKFYVVWFWHWTGATVDWKYSFSVYIQYIIYVRESTGSSSLFWAYAFIHPMDGRNSFCLGLVSVIRDESFVFYK